MELSNVIIDIDGLSLTQEEMEMVKHPSVAGVILFTRNYDNKAQLRELTRHLQQIKPNLIIAVDQEGGRIQRFVNGFTSLPNMQHWGDLYQEDSQHAVEELQQMTRTMVLELQQVGVNLSIAPVLDINHGMNDVIGNRSFSSSHELVTRLGKVLIQTMKSFGMTTVAKHFPGHGGVKEDSHFELPVDQRDFETIWNTDMQPFIHLAADYDAVMPAHIIFSSVKKELVSYSRYWLVDVLREKLNFQGAIMSDDLTMNAATHIGDYDDRTIAAIDAGCDILIACNNRAGAIKVLETSARVTRGAHNPYLDHYLSKFAVPVLSPA